MIRQLPRPNKTDAGNGSKAICRVSNVLRSPSPDPRRSLQRMISKEPDYQLIEKFLAPDEATRLLHELVRVADWDTSMKARKTACYGETYDESGVDFAVREMLPELESLCDSVERAVAFRPTNCLLNYYEDGSSTMGFHSDTTSNLEDGTGIVIVSLGAERAITFRNKEDYDLRHTYLLPHGSLFCMTQETQDYWTHAVKKAATDEPRISLTLRRILAERKANKTGQQTRD